MGIDVGILLDVIDVIKLGLGLSKMLGILVKIGTPV